MRASVRNLGAYPVLSPAWLEMVDSLSRMAIVTEMESNLPQSKDATLWETEEQAVRFIMEDGKLNLILRSMVEYKSYMRKVINTPEEIEVRSHMIECDKFEFGLGGVLRACWIHVEGIQTTDLSELFQYINDVLSYAISSTTILADLHSTGNLLKSQEVLVITYIGQILRHIEILRESRIMPLIRSQGLFMIIIKYIFKISNYITDDIMIDILETMSILVETEDFVTYREKYVSAEDIDNLVEIKKEILMPLQSALKPEKRRALRPLSDAIDKCKRLLGSKK